MFGAVKSTKHPDIGQYKYFGYGIGFERKGFFSLGNEIGINVIIFGVDMNSSPHIDNKKKKDFKAKDFEIIAYHWCSGNISKDLSVDNMKKIGLTGYVFDFTVDYDAIAVGNILDIYKCLMRKHGVK